MKELAGKTAVITGAGSGIGRALSVALAQRGVRLALSDRDGAAVAETVDRIGASARAYTVDVTDAAAVEAHAMQVADEFGRINLVINNAGIALTGTVEDMTLEDFAGVMNVDYWGVVHGTKAFLPHVIESGDGHIVNVSSVFGLIAVPLQSAYNSAKFAVRGFTEALRMEMVLAGHPVRVSGVYPGGIKTDVVRHSRVVGDLDRGAVERGFDQWLAITSAERAAEVIIRGIRRNRTRILVGPDAHAIALFVQLAGPAYQRVVAAQFRRLGARIGVSR